MYHVHMLIKGLNRYSSDLICFGLLWICDLTLWSQLSFNITFEGTINWYQSDQLQIHKMDILADRHTEYSINDNFNKKSIKWHQDGQRTLKIHFKFLLLTKLYLNWLFFNDCMVCLICLDCDQMINLGWLCVDQQGHCTVCSLH